MTGGQENVQTAFLVILDNIFGNFRIRRSADDGGKTRCGSVHKLHPAFTENGIIGRPQPDFSSFLIDILGMQIKIRFVQIA